MKNTVLLFVMALTLICIVGCMDLQPKNTDLEEGKPPKVQIQIDKRMYKTKLGTYCWTTSCVDSAGPVELLKGKEPIPVKPGDAVKFLMNYEPQPNKFHVDQFYEGRLTEVLLKENSFKVPTEKGTYFYSYGVWWMDEDIENQSRGDAFYHFALKVT
ncbi:hypothetical protein [Paenibacillus terrae]|uniref:Uncharacterized protein n=1 Tax=Paenibacillus terrae TaxID=159743 RepID=A0A0D7WUK5_9BACL|nr:hypothetical protein [Paenibacillus terrae]KJD42840.1 hypothetical protein QD47_25995 [Paenibacillus terrae]